MEQIWILIRALSIYRILPSGVRLAYSFIKSSDLFPNNDPVHALLSSNLVYRFQCRQCNCGYVGETRRHLSTRIKEHMNCRPQEFEIIKHSHIAKPEDFSILYRTKYTTIAEPLTLKIFKSLTSWKNTINLFLTLFWFFLFFLFSSVSVAYFDWFFWPFWYF